MPARQRLRRTAPLVLVCSLLSASCSRCGSASKSSSSDTASADDTGKREDRAPESKSAAPESPPPGDVPEVKDPGPGRATAALRAALKAYGVTYDEAAIARDVKIDEEGASIDDLEDQANKLGLDAKQIVLPKESVLLPEAKVLPAITILETADGDRDFVLLYRRDGDRIQVMDPNVGRVWVNRADIERRLFVAPEVTVSAAEWATAEAAPAYRDALRARLVARGMSREAVDRRLALTDANIVGALDAIARQLEQDPSKAGSDPERYVDKELACELDDKCEGVTHVPDDLWTARPATAGGGAPEVHVRGAVMLAIAGKKSASP